ncbi:hypothetical protein RvY_11321 [Ramazzottius varieornatus]|uniref:BTB domain-containing protein n=1 Tax=Ramazzottius varieornatus TaxID=947166 RepID=A0A1D1VFT1_RAMVA|nr:hypothetical protein RvY_11321 [Ramazzottius varieornatus]
MMLRFLYTDRIIPTPAGSTPVEYARLFFRTMDCTRKYDIPELYLACHSWLISMTNSHKDSLDQMCTTILTEVRIGSGANTIGKIPF